MDWNDFILKFHGDFENQAVRLEKKENKTNKDIYIILFCVLFFFIVVGLVLSSYGAVESGILRNFLIGGV